MRLNSSGVLVTTNDASISGLTVGKGGGASFYNTAIGAGALAANTTGIINTAVGSTNGANATLSSNTTGNGNNAFGAAALGKNTTASQNNAFGYEALRDNTTGANNVAIGGGALLVNTTASNNTAVGFQAGYSNTTGRANTFLGANSGYSVTTGEGNTAIGGGVAGLCNAPLQFSTGSYNIAIGGSTLQNATGNNNTGVGFAAGTGNTSGTNNTFLGATALASNTTGANNTAVGYQAGYSTTTVIRNTFIGGSAGYSTTGGTNTFVGESAGYAVTSGTNNTIIGRYDGNQGGLDIRTASNQIVLSDGAGNPRMRWNGNDTWFAQGNITSDSVIAIGQNSFRATSSTGTAYMGFITTATAFQVAFNSTSAGVTLGSGATSWGTFSDSRLKNVTGTYTNALADIAQIEPVKFTWKSDTENKPQVGVIAQSVQAVVPEAVEASTIEMDATEEYLTVRYTELIPLMIASIQELKVEVDSLKQQLGK
jgi:hypothetical protein